MRSMFLAVLLCASAALADDARWHRVVGLLEYLEGDYANALATGDQAELEEQRGFADEVIKQLEAGVRRAREGDSDRHRRRQARDRSDAALWRAREGHLEGQAAGAGAEAGAVA